MNKALCEYWDGQCDYDDYDECIYCTRKRG